MGFLAVITLLLLAAAAFFLWALFLFATRFVPDYLAAALMGVGALFLIALLSWALVRLNR